jgi:A/G-specific adenine glycosylase
MPSCHSAESFADRLLTWWQQHGRHDLPWQHPRTAYRVWVAEIMLQQTQVSTVIKYYQGFLQRFPDLPALACAGVDDIMSAWSGLGYYRRAVNMHRAAQLCMQRHHGALPDNADDLLQLPGIGRSTANAIISQSQDMPLPILDGNLKRVLARHAGISGWPGDSAVERKLWRAAEDRLPGNHGADYTQACMDLGATLCRRRQPNCEQCPVASDCVAREQERQHELPGRKQRKTKTERHLQLLVYRRDEQILLEKRPDKGIWASMWSLPEGDTDMKSAVALPIIRHELTHLRLYITPVLMPREADCMAAEAQLQWHSLTASLQLGLPKPIRDIIEQLPEPS